MKTIVFLHIPKTAGQTIHSELCRITRPDMVSPIRTHDQAKDSDQFPTGYRLYSGHLNWDQLNQLPENRFMFSVLRCPKDRLASFYFYLQRRGRELDQTALDTPQNQGKARACIWTTDDYFFGGDEEWHSFVRDHYDNYYTSYFASKRVRGRLWLQGLEVHQKMNLAASNAQRLDGLYCVTKLGALEHDIAAHMGKKINVVNRYSNVADPSDQTSKWSTFLDQFESDRLRRKIESFVRIDEQLLPLLNVRKEPNRKTLFYTWSKSRLPRTTRKSPTTKAIAPKRTTYRTET